MVLSPTKGAADDLVRNLSLKTSGLSGVHRLTLFQLAAALATSRLAAEQLSALSLLGAEALAARTVHHCLKEKALSYFAPVASMPGFARALASTISELRLENIVPRDLAAVGQPGPDLATLLEGFEQELAARALADLPSLFKFSEEIIVNGRHYLLRLPIVLLDVSFRSTLEKRFLQSLVQQAPAILGTVIGGHSESRKALSELLGVAAEDFEISGHADSNAALPFESALDQTRRFLFSRENPPTRELDASVDFFSAPGQGRESVEIARRVVQAAGAGVRLDQIAVLLRQPEFYQPVLEEALRRARIPAYYSRGTARPDPAGRAFLALLACAEEGLPATRFAEYLSLGQVPSVAESTDPPPGPIPWVGPADDSQLTLKFPEPGPAGEELPETPESDDAPSIAGTLRAPLYWERLLVDAAVIGGRDRWARRLNGLEQELMLQLQETAEDDSRRKYIENQLEQLSNLKKFALPVIDFLDSLPSQVSWGEWLALLRRLCTMVLRDPASVLAILAELEPMSQVGPVALPEVRETLTDRLMFLRVEPPDYRYGQVFVGTIGEAAARSFEWVFLPGLAEGIFPKKVLEDPLLLDDYRQNLPGQLERRQDLVEQERLLLRTAASAARTRLAISYPRTELVEGRARMPSLYALEILRAASGQLPDLKRIEKETTAASGSRLGWPAPRTLDQAIDDAEYDLAVLDTLLHESRQTNKGAARFLLEENAHLARSLRGRFKRWNSRQFTDADGLVDSEAQTVKALQKHRLSERAYSASDLQSYASCPYRFLLQGIHRLRPRESRVAVVQMDPLTRGGLFHAVQFQLFKKLQSEQLLPMALPHQARILDLTDEVLNAVASDHRERLAPAIPRVWEREIEDLRLDLRGWIREAISLGQAWVPSYFEYSFGLAVEPEKDTESRQGEAIVLNGVRLRGSIDLIESNATRTVLRVTDHKTGKVPKEPIRWTGKGEVLQPLLYALAAESQFKLPVESGRLFYCTQRGGFREQVITIDEHARRAIQLVTDSVEEAVREGFFPAAPRHQACTFCDFRIVCGPHEELRTKHKSRQRLQGLDDIRKTR
jgi:ATP-dependent helicase/DNAse subunit B